MASIILRCSQEVWHNLCDPDFIHLQTDLKFCFRLWGRGIDYWENKKKLKCLSSRLQHNKIGNSDEGLITFCTVNHKSDLLSQDWIEINDNKLLLNIIQCFKIWLTSSQMVKIIQLCSLFNKRNGPYDVIFLHIALQSNKRHTNTIR